MGARHSSGGTCCEGALRAQPSTAGSSGCVSSSAAAYSSEREFLPDLLAEPKDMWVAELEALRARSIETRESYNERLRRYLRALTVTVEQQKSLAEAFLHELQTGLECHRRHADVYIAEECSFKMLDGCFKSLPTGKECGVVYALDFGGTNFRAVRVELDGRGGLTVTQKQRSLSSAVIESTTPSAAITNKPVDHSHGDESGPKTLLDATATATQMFDFFAQVVLEFLKESGDDGREDLTCGFTFSYPCAQKTIDSAVLMNWTKGYETGRKTDDPVEGLDVCELMNVAFVRNDVKMRCSCVLNDTVGTLLDCAYEMDRSKPPCLVGLIMGTGFNICYYEPLANRFRYTGHVINIECGNFNRQLPRINVDCELDFKAVANRGLQQLEKMVSGAYLGDIARTVIIKVLQHRAPPMAWQPESLSTGVVAAIMADSTADLSVTRDLLHEVWCAELNAEDVQAIYMICKLVMDRSAALVAAAVAACAAKTGRLQPAFGGLSVGIDGTLYKKNPWIQERMRFHLNNILGERQASLIHLLLADDGSGKGAAALAAVVASGKA